MRGTPGGQGAPQKARRLLARELASCRRKKLGKTLGAFVFLSLPSKSGHLLKSALHGEAASHSPKSSADAHTQALRAAPQAAVCVGMGVLEAMADRQTSNLAALQET